MNTLHGVWIITAGHEHNWYVTNVFQPPGGLYSFAATIETDVN
jgi:hypothetical protein